MPSRSKHAVVTGCNRGLGLAIAQRLVEQGFRVAAVCRRQRDAQGAVQVLGPNCSAPIQLDLAEGATAVQTAAEAIKAWLGKKELNLLVNNAGNSYGGWDDEAWADSRAVNYRGPVLLTEALLPVLATRASVVMVGSGLGALELLSPKYQRLLTKAEDIEALDKLAERSIEALGSEHSWVGPYGLSKALVHRATQIFAFDERFKSKSVSVNAVCPGWVSTDMGGEQAPISPQEGAGHILANALKSDEDVTGSFKCFCYKNYDDEHLHAWEQKHGNWESDDKCAKKKRKKNSLEK